MLILVVVNECPPMRVGFGKNRARNGIWILSAVTGCVVLPQCPLHPGREEPLWNRAPVASGRDVHHTLLVDVQHFSAPVMA